MVYEATSINGATTWFSQYLSNDLLNRLEIFTLDRPRLVYKTLFQAAVLQIHFRGQIEMTRWDSAAEFLFLFKNRKQLAWGSNFVYKI